MANARTEIDRFLYRIDVSPTVWTPAQARAEYSRLRKAANKRIMRLQESEYATSAAAQTGAFQALPKGASDRTVYRALQDVALFMSKKSTTVSGIREAERKMIETMKERGYDFINRKNVKEFGEFWREVKTHATYKQYDSERIVEMFREAKKKRIDPVDLARDFDFWIQHSEKIDDVKRSSEVMSSAEARRRLEGGDSNKKRSGRKR